jgi:DNA-binding transcriptional regulator PaaX
MAKTQYSNKILKVLAEKPAIPMDELTKKIHLSPTPLLPKERGEGVRSLYAITRSIKNLIESGCVEIIKSDNKNYLKLTKKGKNKLNCIRLEGGGALVSNTWDGFWRIIILDIPEERKSEREALRYLLKKANFICIKNTVWISPLPYEHLFTNIKKDLELGTELMIIITDKLDPETNLAFLKSIKK